MKQISKHLVIIIALLSATGCAPKTHYAWNAYDTALYKHYQDPAQNEDFVAALKEIVDEGDASGRIPPGIYAEYGYALYEQGKITDAVIYFQKESDKWPESKFFMTKVIGIAQKRARKPVDRAVQADSDLKKSEVAPVEVKQ